MAKRERPKVQDMDEGVGHSYDHRGDSGRFGNIYKGDVEVWNPSEDEHELAIFSYLMKENSVFREENPDFNLPFSKDKLKEGAWAHKLTILLHWGIGVNKDAVLCPRTLKRPCPICEERDRLIEVGCPKDEEEDKYKKRMMDLSPAKRALYNIFCFDSNKEMKKGIQIWEAPHNSIEDVLSEKFQDRRTGEKRYFMIPEEGWNVFFEKKGKKLNTEYRQVDIVERRKEDKFDEKDLDDLYGMVYNFEEIIEIKSYEEIDKMHIGYVARGVKDEEAEPEKEESRFRGRNRETKEEESERSRGRGEPEKEEKPSRDERSSREEKEETPLEDRKEESDVPEEYQSCFGVQGNQLDKCEDCPKKLWQRCIKKMEEEKDKLREKANDRGGRSGRRRSLDDDDIPF